MNLYKMTTIEFHVTSQVSKLDSIGSLGSALFVKRVPAGVEPAETPI